MEDYHSMTGRVFIFIKLFMVWLFYNKFIVNKFCRNLTTTVGLVVYIFTHHLPPGNDTYSYLHCKRPVWCWRTGQD